MTHIIVSSPGWLSSQVLLTLFVGLEENFGAEEHTLFCLLLFSDKGSLPGIGLTKSARQLASEPRGFSYLHLLRPWDYTCTLPHRSTPSTTCTAAPILFPTFIAVICQLTDAYPVPRGKNKSWQFSILFIILSQFLQLTQSICLTCIRLLKDSTKKSK